MQQHTLPLGGAPAITTPAAPAPRVKNGTWTVRNRRTGEHRTFRIKTQRDDAKFAPGMRVLSLLTGPNNEQDFTGIAFIDDTGVKVWSKRRGTQFEQLAQMFWLVALDLPAPHPWSEGRMQDENHYEFMGEARCVRCNRKLTEPVSIETGIGPECGGRS